MNISLTPALEDFVNKKVATGLYTSVSEVIREALRLLVEKDNAIPQERLAQLEKDVAEGLKEYENDMGRNGHEVMRELIAKYENF